MVTTARPTGDDRAGTPPAAIAAARFLRAQSVNVSQHAGAIRPFRTDEFGARPTAPSAAHVYAANHLIDRLRAPLRQVAADLRDNSREATYDGKQDFDLVLRQKEAAGDRVRAVERVWDFYFELFSQRQTRYAPWLLAADRIGLDCYQAVYSGLGTARSVPSPPPFSCMETGSTPATYRRGVRLTSLHHQENIFPIVQLPFHRLVNPWTLGAIHHEIAHNLQSDLGLWKVVPTRIAARLRAAGFSPVVANVWATWNKEIWADLCGLLLGGPAIVASLIDVVAMSPARTYAFNPDGAHPTPYLRTLINLELLERMEFDDEAEVFRTLWEQLYPAAGQTSIPPAILDSFEKANQIVVNEICYAPYSQFGNRSLAEIVSFNRTHDAMTREAAQRIARGTDPGVVPARFLVGAARWALDRQLAPPEEIARAFYNALVWR